MKQTQDYLWIWATKLRRLQQAVEKRVVPIRRLWLHYLHFSAALWLFGHPCWWQMKFLVFYEILFVFISYILIFVCHSKSHWICYQQTFGLSKIMRRQLVWKIYWVTFKILKCFILFCPSSYGFGMDREQFSMRLVRHQTSKLAYSDGEATRVDRQLSFIAFCTAHALTGRAHGSPASKGR